MSLGEITVLLIVGIVVIGPKNLPSMMRTAGQWVTRLRRMSTDLRSQSGIDDLIRHEGLEKEIAELRSLARMNVVDSLIKPALGAVPSAGGWDPAPNNRGRMAPEVARALEFHAVAPLREREYPLAGCDAHGAMADDAGSYTAHDPEPVATEAPNAIEYDDEGHPIEAAPAVIATDDEGHPITIEKAADAAPIDPESSPEPAASVAVASPASPQESAAS
jgi:sec-independent protein translocase protein TatB